jgi:hypothetical protein
MERERDTIRHATYFYRKTWERLTRDAKARGCPVNALVRQFVDEHYEEVDSKVKQPRKMGEPVLMQSGLPRRNKKPKDPQMSLLDAGD